MQNICRILELGTISYDRGVTIQNEIANQVKEGRFPGAILLLQHTPVFTIGRAGGRENILISHERLREKNIELYETNRGGNVTYHGPGQIVGYPILNLKYWGKDVRLYMYNLEEVIIKTLKRLGVESGRKSQYRGVWVGDRKIAAVGVNVKNWITMHGFSFQITKESSENFGFINPCGITEFGVVSLEEFIPDIKVEDVIPVLKKEFSEVFFCILKPEEYL